MICLLAFNRACHLHQGLSFPSHILKSNLPNTHSIRKKQAISQVLLTEQHALYSASSCEQTRTNKYKNVMQHVVNIWPVTTPMALILQQTRRRCREGSLVGNYPQAMNYWPALCENELKRRRKIESARLIYFSCLLISAFYLKKINCKHYFNALSNVY